MSSPRERRIQLMREAHAKCAAGGDRYWSEGWWHPMMFGATTEDGNMLVREGFLERKTQFGSRSRILFRITPLGLQQIGVLDA